MLATGGPLLIKTVGVLKELSADERTRLIAEAQEKARRDEASRVNWAREEGRREGREEARQEGRREQTKNIARKLIKLNVPIDEIVEATGLTLKEIEELN